MRDIGEVARPAFVMTQGGLRSALVQGSAKGELQAGQRLKLTRDVPLLPWGTLRKGTQWRVAGICEEDGTAYLACNGETLALMPFETDEALEEALRITRAPTMAHVAVAVVAFTCGLLLLPQPDMAAAVGHALADLFVGGSLP